MYIFISDTSLSSKKIVELSKKIQITIDRLKRKTDTNIYGYELDEIKALTEKQSDILRQYRLELLVDSKITPNEKIEDILSKFK